MRVVGTQNAHNLISVSTDGKMCSWSLDMLSQPQVRRQSTQRVHRISFAYFLDKTKSFITYAL